MSTNTSKARVRVSICVYTIIYVYSYIYMQLSYNVKQYNTFSCPWSNKHTTGKFHTQAANLAGFRASEDPRFEAGIPDFMNGILNFSIHFNMVHRKVDWRNPKMKSLNSMSAYLMTNDKTTQNKTRFKQQQKNTFEMYQTSNQKYWLARSIGKLLFQLPGILHHQSDYHSVSVRQTTHAPKPQCLPSSKRQAWIPPPDHPPLF